MTDPANGVGYKKPPKHSQFKKGQSGNPGGRRHLKSGTIRDALERRLQGTFTETGNPVKEEVALALIRKVLLGSDTAIAMLLREFE
jgi:hypothetical protein